MVRVKKTKVSKGYIFKSAHGLWLNYRYGWIKIGISGRDYFVHAVTLEKIKAASTAWPIKPTIAIPAKHTKGKGVEITGEEIPLNR